MAELVRVKGELLLLQGAPGAAAAAEDHFRQALDWARRQGALSRELRAATNLARLRRDQAQSEEALQLMAPSVTAWAHTAFPELRTDRPYHQPGDDSRP
jgi:predicted ATPase